MPDTAWDKVRDRLEFTDCELGLCCGVSSVVLVWFISAICLGVYSWRYAIGAGFGLLMYLGLRMYSVRVWGLSRRKDTKTPWPWVFGGLVAASGLMCNFGSADWHWSEVLACSVCLGIEVTLMCFQDNNKNARKQAGWMSAAFVKGASEELKGEWELHLDRCAVQFGYFKDMAVKMIVGVCTLCAMSRGVFAMNPGVLWLLWMFVEYFCIGVFAGLDSRPQKWPDQEILENKLGLRSRIICGYLVVVSMLYMLGSFMHGLFRYSEGDLVFTTGYGVFLALNLVGAAFVMRSRSIDVLSGIDQHGAGILLTAVGIAIWVILVTLQISVLGMVRLIWQEWMVTGVFSVFVLPMGMLTNAITSVSVRDA